MRILLTLACLTLASGFRQRRSNRNTSALAISAKTLKEADCEQLSDIVIGGRDLGQAAVLLCRFWPAQFGEFPVEEAKTVVDLFNTAGDLWEKIKELAKGRPGAPFCWKKIGMREELNRITLNSLLQMSSTKIDHSASPPWRRDFGREVDVSTCDLEVLGKCYDRCPPGMKSMALIGGFAPVCSSDCVQSTHETVCGFGCATGVGTCVQQLADQVSVVARGVGAVTSYLTGNPLISQVVDQVLRLVEFAIDVVFDVIMVAKHVWNEWPREHVELGVIIALVQFVFEHAQTIGKDFLQLNEMFGETMEMILELIDAEFEWQEINLDFIKDTILKHGMAILGAGFEFAEAFVFPTCEVVSHTNPDYDCTGDGNTECGDWDYWGFECESNGGQCEYQYKFGDFLLDHSCRCVR